MNRRVFLLRAGQAFPIVAGAVYLVDCSGSDYGTNPTPTPTPTPVSITSTSSSSNGHTHTASVPIADLTSASDREYTSSASGGHTHRVTLSAAQLMSISNGQAVTVSSSVEAGHSHDFTFRR